MRTMRLVLFAILLATGSALAQLGEAPAALIADSDAAQSVTETLYGAR